MDERSILVVEDSDKSLKLARTLLELAGHSVLAARTGQAAITIALREHPDVIVMDIQLPDMDGVAVLGRLRAHADAARIPVVAVTAFAMLGDRERLLAAGFDGYLSKPIDVRTFVQSVTQLARHRDPLPD